MEGGRRGKRGILRFLADSGGAGASSSTDVNRDGLEARPAAVDEVGAMPASQPRKENKNNDQDIFKNKKSKDRAG